MKPSRSGFQRAPRGALKRRAELRKNSPHPARSLLLLGMPLSAMALLLGCATQGSLGEARPAGAELTTEGQSLAEHLAATRAEKPAAPGSGIRVRLAFSAGADLDLYVTDPTFETVYFANSPNRAGGRLEEDLRCDAPAPRIETITFPATLAGTYRVGVDFSERCKDGATRVAFAVQIDGVQIDGEPLEATREGTIAAGHFIPVVLEVTAPLGGAAREKAKGRGDGV